MKKRIVNIILLVSTIVAGSVAYGSYITCKKNEQKVKRLDSYYNVMQQWIVESQKGTLKNKLKKYSGKKIAIYGMGTLGELLYNEIKECNLNFCGFIDKNANVLLVGIDETPVFNIKDAIQKDVEVIIVTPVFAFDEIRNDLEEYCGKDIEILSLEDIMGE